MGAAGTFRADVDALGASGDDDGSCLASLVLQRLASPGVSSVVQSEFGNMTHCRNGGPMLVLSPEIESVRGEFVESCPDICEVGPIDVVNVRAWNSVEAYVYLVRRP